MATSAESSAAAPVNWPAVDAWTLLATTAELLSFGALVTTYDAAMAVPDWPGTFGHNMLLFPFADWFWGPWDLFLEHGHRLSCSALVLGDLLVTVPEESQGRKQVIRKTAREMHIELDPAIRLCYVEVDRPAEYAAAEHDVDQAFLAIAPRLGCLHDLPPGLAISPPPFPGDSRTA